MSGNIIRQMDCAAWQVNIEAVSTVLASPDGIADALELLNGAAYCESFDTTDTVAACQYYVNLFVPLALPELANHIRYHAQETCGIVFPELGC